MDNEKILEIVLRARDEASKVIAGVGDQVEQSSKLVGVTKVFTVFQFLYKNPLAPQYN